MNKLKRSVTLEFTDFQIDGEVSVTLWGGGEGSINMKDIFVTEEDVKNGTLEFNDNGFGVESINQANDIGIYARYDSIHLVYLTSMSDCEPAEVLEVLKQYLAESEA
jgi:hypothetical protein